MYYLCIYTAPGKSISILMASTWLRSGLTTADDHYKLTMGSKDVIGLQYGELYGKRTNGDLFSTSPKASVGISFEIRFPVFPIAFFRFTFMYAGPGTEWFKFNM